MTDNAAIPEIVVSVAPLPVDAAPAPEAVLVAVPPVEPSFDVAFEVFAEVDEVVVTVGPSVYKAELANETQLLDAGILAV